jgi:hypothetical protein
MWNHKTLLLILGLCSAACAWARAEEPVKALPQAHAHNDYEHKRPLLDALDHGFCSVEADIHLADGQLLVAHDRKALDPARTLQALYLDPLRARARQHSGRIYPGGPEFFLLIDLKGDWETTYPVLRAVLKQYAEMLSSFTDGKKEARAVTVVLSGNRAKPMFDGETTRYAALDGTLDDLHSGEPATLIPWVSANWARSFQWRGSGAFPDPEKVKLKEWVALAHQQGRKVRFWGAPDKKDFWRELVAHDVDLVNTDDLAGLQKFLLKEGKP